MNEQELREHFIENGMDVNHAARKARILAKRAELKAEIKTESKPEVPSDDRHEETEAEEK